MKLIVDMNLSPRWVQVLVDAGFEATHWSSLGAHNAPDSEIMAYASVNDSVVLTHDLDFGSILAATHGEKPSVVQIRAGDVRAREFFDCCRRRDGRQGSASFRRRVSALRLQRA